MALWLQEDQRVRVQKVVEEKEKYIVLHLSSSRKEQDGTYKYSDWGFVRFVGKARTYISENSVGEKAILSLKKAQFTKESYMKDGETVRPKNAQLVVFSCELYRAGSSASSKPTAEVVPYDEDEIPF